MHFPVDMPHDIIARVLLPQTLQCRAQVVLELDWAISEPFDVVAAERTRSAHHPIVIVLILYYLCVCDCSGAVECVEG